MAKKDIELSKTARASLAQKADTSQVITNRSCAKCGERIVLKELLPVKTDRGRMVYYHRAHYLS